MILAPAPLRKPAAQTVALPVLRRALPPPVATARPVLHTARVPQQLCLDLQPRLR